MKLFFFCSPPAFPGIRFHPARSRLVVGLVILVRPHLALAASCNHWLAGELAWTIPGRLLWWPVWYQIGWQPPLSAEVSHMSVEPNQGSRPVCTVFCILRNHTTDLVHLPCHWPAPAVTRCPPPLALRFRGFMALRQAKTGDYPWPPPGAPHLCSLVAPRVEVRLPESHSIRTERVRAAIPHGPPPAAPDNQVSLVVETPP